MPKIIKPVKYKRAPDGKFAKKDAPVRKFSTKNWQCAKPVKKILNTLNGELHYKISKEYPLHGCYIQTCKETSIEDLTNAFIVKEQDDLDTTPNLKTYNVRFWGDVVDYELKEGPGIHHVTKGGFEVIEEISYKDLIEMKYGSEAGGNKIEHNIGPDNRGTDNVGKGNFGSHNTGLENCGYYNKGVRLLGVFNTEQAGFFMFNRPVVTKTPWWEIWYSFPKFLKLEFKYGLDDARWQEIYTLREQFEKAVKQDDWGEEHAKLLALPNFDYAIFEEITGISKQELDKSYDAWYKRTHSFKRKHK